jgi:hypothetical protein
VTSIDSSLSISRCEATAAAPRSPMFLVGEGARDRTPNGEEARDPPPMFLVGEEARDPTPNQFDLLCWRRRRWRRASRASSSPTVMTCCSTFCTACPTCAPPLSVLIPIRSSHALCVLILLCICLDTCTSVYASAYSS